MARNKNCLGLGGDGDETQLLKDVEQAFGVTITDAEAESCETIGQVYDLVSQKLQAGDAPNLGCPTAIAFFRLRRELRRLGNTRRITPQTKLADLLPARRFKSAYGDLVRRVGFNPPPVELRPASGAILMLVLIFGASLSLWLGSWAPFLSGVLLAIILAALLPTTVPKDMACLGEFARHCAAWNFGTIARMSGGVRANDLANALALVVRESCGTGFKGEINRDTRLYC